MLRCSEAEYEYTQMVLKSSARIWAADGNITPETNLEECLL
jgi:hypothetical protein